MPAWAWCLHTERGREFIVDVEAAIEKGPAWEMIEANQAAQRRSWLLSSDVGQAVLIEETWTDGNGRWHASFKLSETDLRGAHDPPPVATERGEHPSVEASL